jgi:hypothetical protein
MKTVLTALALAATLAGEIDIKNDSTKNPPAKVEVKARGKEGEARTTSPATAGVKGKTDQRTPSHRVKVLSVREITGRCQ